MTDQNDLVNVMKVVKNLKGVSFIQDIAFDIGKPVPCEIVLTGQLVDDSTLSYIKDNIRFTADCDIKINGVTECQHMGFELFIQKDFFNLESIEKASFKLNDDHTVVIKDLSEVVLETI